MGFRAPLPQWNKHLPPALLMLLPVHTLQFFPGKGLYPLLPAFLSFAAASVLQFWKHRLIVSLLFGLTVHHLLTHYVF